VADPSLLLCLYWLMSFLLLLLLLLLQHTVLKAAPGDPDALACKAVALLQDQEYEAADKVLQHKAIKEHMPLERVSTSSSSSSSTAARHATCQGFGNARLVVSSQPLRQQQQGSQLGLQPCSGASSAVRGDRWNVSGTVHTELAAPKQEQLLLLLICC
jgi:hypothetical protein